MHPFKESIVSFQRDSGTDEIYTVTTVISRSRCCVHNLAIL